MAKMMDITDKLSFEENPKLRIKEQELEIHGDAATVLRILALLGNGEPGASEVLECADLLLGRENREKLDTLNLSFADYMKVVNLAMALVLGEENGGEGAGGDPTMT